MDIQVEEPKVFSHREAEIAGGTDEVWASASSSCLSRSRTPAAGTYQRPKDVDREKCYSECYESDGLQPAVELQVVLGPAQTQPARDGRQRSDEQETHHVAEQRPLLIAGPGVLQPLREGWEKGISL